MEINIFQVDAFSSKPFGGNPAGVVPNAKRLNDKDMQMIANEMNLSETAFVFKRDRNLFKVRFFTPLCEVDLCGHATIATFYILAKQGYIEPVYEGTKKVFMDTRIGRFPIEINFSNYEPEYIMMEQDKPRSLGKLEGVELEELLKTMNLKMDDVGIGEDYIPAEIISTGLPDIMLPIKRKDILDGFEVDFCAMKDVCTKFNVTGVHAFYLPEKNSDKVYTRNFGPAVGIDEEAATGTANGALIYYLKKNSLINNNKITSIQGEVLNRPSKIYCFIEEDGDSYNVKVGGHANITLDGIIIF